MATMDTGAGEQFDPRSLLELRLPPEGRLQLMGDVDDGRGLVLVLWHANSGIQVALTREQVESLDDQLDSWLLESAPEPDVPGRFV